MRTWAPCGKTPVLEFDFNWKKLSVIGGITVLNFYFKFYPGTIKSPQVIELLKHLQQQLPGKLLLIWDGATIHRSRLVRAYLESLQGRLYAAALPAYAPELNPIEYAGVTSSNIGSPTSAPEPWPTSAPSDARP